MPTTNPQFKFKPGSATDRVLDRQPLAHCRKTDRGGDWTYVVYISRRSKMILGHGNCAVIAWQDALKNIT